MKILCFSADTVRDKRVTGELAAGFRKHGEHVDLLFSKEGVSAADYGLVAFVGVRKGSIKARNLAQLAGVPTLMLDKGYFNRGRYHRFALYTPQPSYVVKMDYDTTRLAGFESQGFVRFKEANAQSRPNIIYVESTQKYYDFHGLGDVTEYSQRICSGLVEAAKLRPDLQVLYRPRAQQGVNETKQGPQPSVVPQGTTPTPKLAFHALLEIAHCVVVHGSNAGVEALCAGVPVLSVGSLEVNPVHDLCGTEFEYVVNPKVPHPKKIRHRMAQLAWCQFNHGEIEGGFAWDHVKRWMR